MARCCQATGQYLDQYWWIYTATWWRYQMEILSASLTICAGNSPVTGEFPAQRPVTRSFDVFFNLRLNKRLRKHSRGWWFETQSQPLWRHCNDMASWVQDKLELVRYVFKTITTLAFSIRKPWKHLVPYIITRHQGANHVSAMYVNEIEQT